MKIMLVRPKPDPATIGLQSIMVCEPLELEYLAAAAGENHQVILVDMILEKQPLSSFIQLHQPQIVAITSYIAQVNVVKNYARIVKTHAPEIQVVVGGVHADVLPEDFQDSQIDFIISGDGINSWQKLVRWLDSGRADPAPARIIRRPPTAAPPPVFPDRAITAKYRPRYYYVYHNPCALIKTSYGCPYGCLFCFCRQITGGNYAERDLSEVIAELQSIVEPEIYIVDDNFLVDAQRVEKFCRLLTEHRLEKHFLIYGRADFIAAHPETIAHFQRCGLRAVIVGLESPDPAELDRYAKGSSVQTNEQAVAILNRLGIDCYATLILGIDWDEDDFHRLYLWLKKLKLRFINLQPLTPLPGTPLFQEYSQRLLIPRERYEQWDLANLIIQPGKISVRQYYYQILKVYFRITLHPVSVWQNRKYGIAANLKLSLGVAKITWQYLQKIRRG